MNNETNLQIISARHFELKEHCFPAISCSCPRLFPEAPIPMSPHPFTTKSTQTQAHDEGVWSVKWSKSPDEEAKHRIITGSIDDTVKAWVW